MFRRLAEIMGRKSKKDDDIKIEFFENGTGFRADPDQVLNHPSTKKQLKQLQELMDALAAQKGRQHGLD